MSEVPGCENCEWNEFCNGSCPGMAHQLTGDFNTCQSRGLFQEFLTGDRSELWAASLSCEQRKPSRPGRASSTSSGVPPLTSLDMYISGSCNLACRHCWIEPDYQADNKNGKFLKFEYLKKAIKEAKPLGLQSVKLTGGEPMLHPQFRKIVDHIESQKVGMIMETNGTLIDNEMANYLKSKKHFNFVSVSLDGAKPETHDKLRGVKGSFKKATAGIKSLVKAGFHPQLICTLHKGNVRSWKM